VNCLNNSRVFDHKCRDLTQILFQHNKWKMRISNSVDGTLRQIGTNLLILYGSYSAYNVWSPPTNELHSFDISTNTWSWIEGNSTGPAILDSYGYYPSPLGVANETALQAPGVTQSSFVYDNKMHVFGGQTYSGLVFDTTFVYEVCGRTTHFFQMGLAIPANFGNCDQQTRKPWISVIWFVR
jgi:hypothetical protein